MTGRQNFSFFDLFPVFFYKFFDILKITHRVHAALMRRAVCACSICKRHSLAQFFKGRLIMAFGQFPKQCAEERVPCPCGVKCLYGI